jgi:hypothetical protein
MREGASPQPKARAPGAQAPRPKPHLLRQPEAHLALLVLAGAARAVAARAHKVEQVLVLGLLSAGRQRTATCEEGKGEASACELPGRGRRGNAASACQGGGAGSGALWAPCEGVGGGQVAPHAVAAAPAAAHSELCRVIPGRHVACTTPAQAVQAARSLLPASPPMSRRAPCRARSALRRCPPRPTAAACAAAARRPRRRRRRPGRRPGRRPQAPAWAQMCRDCRPRGP